MVNEYIPSCAFPVILVAAVDEKVPVADLLKYTLGSRPLAIGIPV